MMAKKKSMLANYQNIDEIEPQFRKEYSWGEFEDHKVLSNPLLQFAEWFGEAVKHQVMIPNAMNLSTVSKKSVPSCRVMLLKGFDEKGFKFFTHYLSPKAMDLTHQPKATITFFWPEIERQVRITGKVKRMDQSESEVYFEKRPRDAQIGAWLLSQSKPVQNRKAIDETFKALQIRFKDKKVPRPESWGGYRLIPDQYEFWQGRASRLNDRIFYTRSPKGQWKWTRLYP